MTEEQSKSPVGPSTAGQFPEPSQEELETSREEEDSGYVPGSSMLNIETENQPPDQAEASRESDENSCGHAESNIKHFTSEGHFVINCIGVSVNLGNLWQFPYYASLNGGGTFLLAYIVVTIFITIPLVYMEIFLGQFSRLGSIGVWSSCPFFKGVGVSALISSDILLIYYCVMMSYGVFYGAQVFRSELPWADCEEWWGANKLCYRIENGELVCKFDPRCNVTLPESSADQFWKIYVLGLSTGFGDIGTIRWKQAICLFLTWTYVVLLCIYRHYTKLKLNLKPLYITAFSPFVVLLIYLMYAIYLPGAWSGLGKLFVPSSKLFEAAVWEDSLKMSVYSLRISSGVLILFGSKNEDSYKIGTGAAITCFFDFIASVLASSVTFCITGFMSKTWNQFNTRPPDLEISGEGLVFITFTNALLNMRFPHLYAFLIFSMLFFLGTDLSVGILQSTSRSTRDVISYLCPSKKYRKLNPVIVACVLYLAGLICITNGGAFIFAILEEFVGGTAVLGIIMFEAIAFGWGYGITRVSSDIQKLHGTSPPMLLKLCWVVIAPVSLIILFGLSLKDIKLNRQYNIPYPPEAKIVAWSLIVLVLMPVPVGMVLNVWRNKKDVSKCFQPGKPWIDAVRRHERKQSV